MSNDQSVTDKVSNALDQAGETAGRTVGGPLGQALDGAGGFLGKAVGWLKDGHNWMKTNAPQAYGFGMLLVGAPLIMRAGKSIIQAASDRFGIKGLENFGDNKGFKGFLQKGLLIGGALLGANFIAKRAIDGKKPESANDTEAANMRRKALGIENENTHSHEHTHTQNEHALKNQDVDTEIEMSAIRGRGIEKLESLEVDPADIKLQGASDELENLAPVKNGAGTDAGDSNDGRLSAFKAEWPAGSSVTAGADFNTAAEGTVAETMTPNADPALEDKAPAETNEAAPVVSAPSLT